MELRKFFAANLFNQDTMEKTSLKESSEYGGELELQDLFSADKEEMHNKEAAVLVVMKDIADSMQDVRDSIKSGKRQR